MHADVFLYNPGPVNGFFVYESLTCPNFFLDELTVITIYYKMRDAFNLVVDEL